LLKPLQDEREDRTMPRSKTLWALLPALLSLGPGAVSPALAGAAQATASASGKVVDEAGRPVQGARVELITPGTGDGADPSRVIPGPYQANSGPDGRFRILDVPADSWFSLGISQRDFTVLAENGILTPVNGGQVALGTFRLPKVPIVAGKVVDSKGHPLAGARVWARSAKDSWLGIVPPGGQPAAVTGADGRFEIPSFEPGTLEVCWKDLPSVQLTPQPSRLNRIVLTPPPPPSRITGRVIDDRGLPVTGAKVHLRSIPDPNRLFVWRPVWRPVWHPCSPQRPDDELVTLSDREGRFTFELTGSGRMSVGAEAAGYLRQADSAVSHSPQSPGKIELVLEGGAIVSGRVLTAGGLPAAGAEISISGGRNHDTTPALTDGGGGYRVVGVEPGDQAMEIRHPSGQARRKLAVARGENRWPDLVLDNDEIREIRGRVIGSGGGPVADAVLSIAYPAALQAATAVVSTAPDGSFRLSFRRSLSDGGPFGVTVVKPGYQKKFLRLDPAAAFSASLEIRLEPGTRLTGHILGFDAERLTDVSVEARQGEDRFRSSVSRDGKYRIADLGAGDWTVTAEDYEHHCGTARVTLEPGVKETALDLQILSEVEVQGTVLAPDGTPVEGAKVTFRNADKDAPTCEEDFTATASSTDDGTFSTQVPEGRYSVVADAEGYAPTVQGTPLTIAALPVEGLEIRLGSGSRLSGRLFGLHPGEAASASISATAGSHFRHGQVFADGTYRFDDLGPGDWSVGAIVSLSGSRVWRQGRVELEPGQAAATLNLDLLGELSVTVRFASGDEPVLLNMSLSQPGAEGENTETVALNNENLHRFSRLPAGMYRLKVEDEGHHRSFERMIDLSSDQELTIDLLNPEDP
jgi:protocatechuate 3,4-dioxygenase beta subunit